MLDFRLGEEVTADFRNIMEINSTGLINLTMDEYKEAVPGFCSCVSSGYRVYAVSLIY